MLRVKRACPKMAGISVSLHVSMILSAVSAFACHETMV